MDQEIQELLNRVRTGVTTPDDASALERHLTSDSMIPEIRNRLAYTHHIRQHDNSGVHVHVDLNDFGMINKRYGDHVGDEAIVNAGKIISHVGKKWGGRVFRSGGDEFKLWFLQPHHAENFSKELGEHLSLHDGVTGDHKLSASVGIGHSRQRAEDALVSAKSQIKSISKDGHVVRFHPEGQSPTVVKSNLIHGTPEGWKSAEESIKGANTNQP